MLRTLLFLLCAANLLAQGPRVHIKKLPGEDWAPLFNGKDLNGWVEVGKEKWMVKMEPSTAWPLAKITAT